MSLKLLLFSLVIFMDKAMLKSLLLFQFVTLLSYIINCIVVFIRVYYWMSHVEGP
jgi:hypothetical protein